MNRAAMLQRSRTGASRGTSSSSAAARPASASPSTPRRAATRRCCSKQRDFGKGTSSRSTKLVHGGVRYLQQGNISLVLEALRERGACAQNAPHLVTDLRVRRARATPGGSRPFYGIGLDALRLLAGQLRLRPSRSCSRARKRSSACPPSTPTACAAACSTTTASSTTPGCSSTSP